MEFGGLKETTMTYADKLVYHDELKRKHGLIPSSTTPTAPSDGAGGVKQHPA